MWWKWTGPHTGLLAPHICINHMEIAGHLFSTCKGPTMCFELWTWGSGDIMNKASVCLEELYCIAGSKTWISECNTLCDQISYFLQVIRLWFMSASELSNRVRRAQDRVPLWMKCLLHLSRLSWGWLCIRIQNEGGLHWSPLQWNAVHRC